MGVKLAAASGGSVELVPTNTASNYTATVPAATTTLVGTDTSQTLTNKTLTTPNFDSAQVATVSGSAPLYMCRAWVNFNGGGSPITVAAGGNVSSITDGGTGTYTVNLTTAMPDTNYSAVATAQSGVNGTILRTATFSTSSFIVYTSYVNFPGSNMPSLDCIVCVAVFR